MKPFANIIAGEAVALADLKPDISPSDTNDVVGEFACASVNDAEDAVAGSRSGGTRIGSLGHDLPAGSGASA